MGCLLTSYSGERVGCLTCTQTYGHATLQLAIKGYVYTEKHMADNDKVLCFDEPTYDSRECHLISLNPLHLENIAHVGSYRNLKNLVEF